MLTRWAELIFFTSSGNVIKLSSDRSFVFIEIKIEIKMTPEESPVALIQETPYGVFSD